MLDREAKRPDARPTERDLQSIAQARYEAQLSHYNDQLRQYPYCAAEMSVSNRAFVDYYGRLARNGGHVTWVDGEDAVGPVVGWTAERIANLKTMIAMVEAGEIVPIAQRLIKEDLIDLGYHPHKGHVAMVERVLYPTYRDACLEAERVLQAHLATEGARVDDAVCGEAHSPSQSTSGGVVVREATGPVVSASTSVDAETCAIPLDWRHLTPTQVAEKLIANTPTMSDHRRGGKRQKTSVGEQTLRQIRWAAALLERSMAGRPFWTATENDLLDLDKWFERLPITLGKAPWHREATTTLEMIYADSLERIENGEIASGDIGLQPGTTNKHFRKLAQMHLFIRENVPSIKELPFSKFMVSDDTNQRDVRSACTIDQGRALFNLAPWTGCSGVNDRFVLGDIVLHDSLYFVLILVWYTGMRREEVCKLLLSDVREQNGIPYINIDFTEAGRVKGNSSVRVIALADEVLRLGFLDYCRAMKAENQVAVFPELVSERAGAKKGDTFYKLWWIYIAPLLPSLKRGQAMHAARHMVSDELKVLEVFSEDRNDALGHAGHGESERRYAKATRLVKLQSLVNKIPIVTNHLDTFTSIKLLPKSCHRPRPQRVHSAINK